MKIALLGAGQLGGSFAMALKEGMHDLVIKAYDPVTAHAEFLLKSGVVDAITTSPAEAVRGAELVLLASPLGTYRPLAEAIAPALAPGTIVMDLGSVKAPMLTLAALLPQARLIPAHPICGSERSGPQVARADLFRGRLCILTPEPETDPAAFGIAQTLWQATGADVIEMPVPVHDQIYAYVSHLPHIIAFVAASYFHRLGVTVTADDTMLHQFLRISRSNPLMWRDIALANREQLLPVLATYIAVLEHFATELRGGERTQTNDGASVAKAYLPRILAASLISNVSLHEKQSGMNLRPFGAGGMRDIVAPAAHAPEGDMEAISAVSHALADHLDAIIVDFRRLETGIGAEDAAALLAELAQMVNEAHMLVSLRN